MPILNAQELADACGISRATVYGIQRETKGSNLGPFEKGKPVRADLAAFREYCTKRSGGKIKLKEGELPERAQRSEARFLFEDFDFDSINTGDLDEDIQTARLIAARMRIVIANWDLDSVSTDKDSARVFGQYTEIMSKTLQRIGKQEKELIAIKTSRGELLPVAQVNELMRQLVDAVLAGIADHTKAHVDIFKGYEIDEYETSKIDSERMKDDLVEADEKFRERMAEAYETLSLEGD